MSEPATHLDPAELDRRLQEALGLQRQGRLAQASAAYESLLARCPDHPDLLHLSGLALAELGALPEALGRLQAAIARAPRSPLYPANLALLLSRLARHGEAAESCRRSLALDPEQPATWYHLGNCLGALGEPQEAAGAYRQALARRADYLKAWVNLGGVLRDLGRMEEARAAYGEAIRQDPNHAGALANLGNLLRECGDPFRAVRLCETALGLDPRSHRAWNNLGSALRESGRLAESIAAYEHALAIDPGHAPAHLNLAMALLALGDYRRGWPEYEWRWQAAPDPAQAQGGGRRDLGVPQWQGEPIAGRTLLLHAEQGLGDALQFVRYVPLVARLGARVILECQPELVRLFARIPGASAVLARGEPLPACDLHCPLMSLPLAFGTRVETIPAEVPYLSADPTDLAQWNGRLGPGPRIGLVWAGNPRRHDPVSHLIDRRRSLHPARLARLGALGPATWVALQKDVGATGAGLPFDCLDPMAGMGDFLDTAALVANLDLVVAVDTSVAHLAGALGRPVWLLSRFDACWRWLDGLTDSPWYPGLRVFRQPSYGDWDGALAELESALTDWLAEWAGPRPGAQPGPEALHRAGVRAAQQGDLARALDLLGRAVAKRPGAADWQADLGLVLAGLGRADQAALHYRTALGLDPGQAAVWFNLGNALASAGRPLEAESAYREALGRKPAYTKAQVNLANLLRRRGDLEGAARLLGEALAQTPGHPGASCNLGLVLSDLGRHGEALGVLKPLIETDPALPGPWQQYGIALHRAGQCREAATAFRRALGLDPGLAETWCNLAAALLGCGEPQGAREAAERALDLAPDLPRAWQALGAARLKDGDLQGAVEACRRFAELGPDDPDAWGDLALALRGAGRFEEAIDACDRGLRVRPDSPQLLATRASARWESGAAAESAADCERAIAIDSQDPDTWNSLGIARHLLRDLPGAQSAYGQALRLDPGHAAAHMNLALVLLARGEYERGWAEYEWRWEGSRGGLAGRRDLPLPQWRGEPLRGEAILLHTEQGLGDAIQFARYVPLVAERGGRAILECYPELVRLFSRLPGVERVVPTGSLGPEGLGAIAWHCPLMSLPLAFGTRVETIPADLPYLSPDPADRSRWAQRLARLAGAKVGLVWAGNPRPEDPVNHRIDRRRSLALGQLAPLLATPGIAFVSLQKGPPAAQAQGTGLLDWGGELGDFAVTAALVANLDLVISVDTSVAHLAGALGRPVWLLSRHDACWRWLEGRDDSPWYPGMRIFRQQAPGDWPSAIDPLAAALADWAAQRRG